MRFLPVFLDLQTGPVLLVGSGDLARAKITAADGYDLVGRAIGPGR